MHHNDGELNVLLVASGGLRGCPSRVGPSSLRFVSTCPCAIDSHHFPERSHWSGCGRRGDSPEGPRIEHSSSQYCHEHGRPGPAQGSCCTLPGGMYLCDGEVRIHKGGGRLFRQGRGVRTFEFIVAGSLAQVATHRSPQKRLCRTSAPAAGRRSRRADVARADGGVLWEAPLCQAALHFKPRTVFYRRIGSDSVFSSRVFPAKTFPRFPFGLFVEACRPSCCAPGRGHATISMRGALLGGRSPRARRALGRLQVQHGGAYHATSSVAPNLRRPAR